MSATASSNGNENSAGGPDPDRPWAGAAGYDAVLEALLRARRDGSAAWAPADGVFALDAGPEPEVGDETDAPLRSRSGGVNKPRAAEPAALLADEATRLVDAAQTKRARMVTAIGVPAVFLAATGVAVIPTAANAASSTSPPTPSSTACAPGSSAVANNGAPAAAPSSSAPTSAPSSAAGKPSTPGTLGPTSAKPSTPVAKPSSAPPVQPTPTGAPSGPTAPAPSGTSTSSPPAKPGSTPSPSSSTSSWNLLGGLLGGLVGAPTSSPVYNPSSSPSGVANQLSTTPSSNPTSSPTPILSIGPGGSSSSPSPSGAPTSVPSTPQPTSSGSTPGTPSSSGTKPSASTSSPSGPPTAITYGGKTYQLPATSCVTPAAPNALREVEWHLDASSLTLNNQKFEGFQQIQTGDGRTVTVMVVHADSIQLTDMVTYNLDGNRRIYSDGGKGKTVSLTNVTLHVLQQKGTLVAPLPLGPVTLGPPGEAGTDLGSILAMGALELNISLGPTVMTNVHVDQYTMASDTLNIPGFSVSLNG